MPATARADLEEALAAEIVRRLRGGYRNASPEVTPQNFAALEAGRGRLRMEAIWGKLLDLERLLESGTVLGP